MASSPDWRVDVLRKLGAPVTAANLLFLTNWQRHEGGQTNNNAHWNWLNSTSGSQYPSINSVGVRSYPNYVTGINFTAATIANGRYQNIVRGLKAGNPYNPTLRQGMLGDLSTWVSGSRTGGLSYAASVLGTAGLGFKQAEGIAKQAPGASIGGPFGPQITSASGAVSSAVDTITAPAKAIAWAFNNWDRVLEVLGGFVFLLLGLILMGRAVGLSGMGKKGLAGGLANRMEFGPTVTQATRDPGLSKPQKVYVEGRAPRAGEPGSSQLAAGEELPF